jgi:hypothetical protein
MIAFDDNSEAEDFVKAFKEPGSLFFQRTREGVDNSAPEPTSTTVHPFESFSGGGEIVGLYFKPTRFCDCYRLGDYDKKEGYTRGKKYGLFIHKCGMPSRLGWQDGVAHKLTGFGYNLLESSAHKVLAKSTTKRDELGFHPATQGHKQEGGI